MTIGEDQISISRDLAMSKSITLKKVSVSIKSVVSYFVILTKFQHAHLRSFVNWTSFHRLVPSLRYEIKVFDFISKGRN